MPQSYPSQTKDQPGELVFHGPRSRWSPIDLREVWRFRDLIIAFGMRDLKVRYRQTVVGLFWALLQPLGTVAIFGTLIYWLRGKPSDGSVPYIVTSLCGMVPWQFFAASVSQATLSIALNGNLIKKVYFPRVILPLSVFVPATIDFLVALGLLGLSMAYFQVRPTLSVLAMPLLLIATLVVSAAFSLWLSALNGIYRDVQFAVPFVLQMGMMASPVLYETDAVVPPGWQQIYYLNPLAALIQCYRAALLGSPWPSTMAMAISIFAVALLLISGSVYFRRMERYFADLV